MDRFAETAAILISIASNTVAIMGCLGGKCVNYINFPLEHPIISSETKEMKMAAVSSKRSLLETHTSLI